MATTAPSRGHIDVRELWSLPSLYHPVLSHGRDRIAFYWDASGRIELYVLELKTRQVRQLSHGEPPRALRSFYIWTPDDRALVFARDEKGNENHDLYRIDSTTGAVTRLTNDPKSEKHAIGFSPHGAWLTVNSNRRHPSEPDKPGQMNVWRMRADGGELAPLTKYTSPANGGRFSPDGAWLLFNTDEEAPGTRNRDGYVMRADGSEPRRVFRVKQGAIDVITRWLPDGKRVVVQSDASGTPRTGVLELASGEVSWLGNGERDEYPEELSPSGKQLLVSRHADAAHQLVAYDIATGKAREARIPAGVVGNADWIDEDRIVYSQNTSATRTGLLLHDLASGKTETLVAPEYGALDAGRFVEAQHIWYESLDGTKIPALLYPPRDVASGERRPAMVQAHGGPTGQWTRTFDQFAQALLDRGFVVIQPNVRGSTGYGVPHRDAALRDWGGIDLDDIEGAVNYLKTLPEVDPERIGIMGGSYGGFMSFIAATKKPALTNDPRCPVSQSRLFVDRLRELGRREGEDFTYVEWDDEGHGSVDIAAKIRRFSLVLDWLSETLAA